MRCSLLLLFLSLLSLSGLGSSQLSVDFYNRTCPDVDKLVHSAVSAMANQSNVVTPSTLRLLAHDCFVEGCDASILITSTTNNTAERDATENNIPQQAFDTIIQAKKAVEAACPGVVSCADIVVMAARDAVVLAGGPHWEVTKGRRDGLISQASRVPGRLPGADFNVSELIENFAAVNLTADDMVILSGAHTLGFSHCNQFRSRLYSFDGVNGSSDPSVNASYIGSLKVSCPPGETGPGKFTPFDVSSPFVFDNSYYKNLQIGRGLLFADQVLFTDNTTRPLVNEMADSQDDFFAAFVQAMTKMSNISVKTGSDGEIRQSCSSFNAPPNSTTPT
ncbi:hypothetical protein SELMODRAFT_79034 [Selaginella moellendorffii]|uniref:Peroxidase n=1 Tax=Selaginella moellendorffii TaxID=88036 RepID=D8QUT9_SELML|nr:peroxidase 51 [Selaginella moellendorffii]XP_024515907.1 peroxidase 51 [Selaginella moellendorffii]EFJ36350.1 hypothetical protein SELMODRAFT_79034 [Selaginella moellendorffii]|eukprot:XP_002962887.1 peroxidase 51 [Selaginella moellendorffii]